eukprot:gene7074-9618_t
MGNASRREKQNSNGNHIASGFHYHIHLSLEVVERLSEQPNSNSNSSNASIVNHDDGTKQKLSNEDVSGTSKAKSTLPPSVAEPTLKANAVRSLSRRDVTVESTSLFSVSTNRSSLSSSSTIFEVGKRPIACVGGSFRPGASIDPLKETPYYDLIPHRQEVTIPTNDSKVHIDEVTSFILEPHPGSHVVLKKSKIILPLTNEPSFAIIVQGTTYTTSSRRDGKILHLELAKPDGDCILYARLYALRSSGTDGEGRHRHVFEVRTTSESVILAKAQGHVLSGFDVIVSDFVASDHPMYSIVLSFIVTILLSKIFAHPRRLRSRALSKSTPARTSFYN